MLSVIPLISADTGRFDGYSYAYRVETQAEVDALPKTIDASTFDIGILVEGSGLVLDGFTITGSNGYGDTCIAVDGQSDVTVINCETIEGFLGIYYWMSSGKINYNDVHDYIKNGITSNEDSIDGNEVDIKWNLVEGRGPLAAGDWAQNGIQVGYGSVANVMFNQVRDNYYIPDDWAATGILLFETSHCTVQGNLVESNDVGIGIETWAWYDLEASYNKVVKNVIVDSDWAISLQSIAWDGYTNVGNPICYNNKIANNIITDRDNNVDDVGISYGAYDASATYDPITENTKIIHNIFNDVDDEIEAWGGDTNTKVQSNVY